MSTNRWALPLMIGGGVLLVGGVAWAFAGDDSGGGGGGGGLEVPLVQPPSTPSEIASARTAMCTCLRGGITDGVELTLCTLQQVYPDVPWRQLMDAGISDAPELTTQVVAQFGDWARELLALDSEGDRAKWCNPGVVDPPPVVFDPPEPGPPGPVSPPGGTDPAPVSNPPPAPYWDPNLIPAEHATVVSVVNRYELGQLSPPSGTAPADYLTDIALGETYGINVGIPKNWAKGDKGINAQNPGGWQTWVDTWQRIRAMVGAEL